jgi:hypothetical protein
MVLNEPVNSALEQGSKLVYEYKVLSLTETSAMTELMNILAGKGWIFVSIHPGVKKFGGRDLVVIMNRNKNIRKSPLFTYQVIATAKPGILEDKLNKFSKHGFYFRDQTVCETSYGGEEMFIVMEKRVN